MNVAVVGSRDWPDRTFVMTTLWTFDREVLGNYDPCEEHPRGLVGEDMVVVSGGARGVDTMASDYAIGRGAGVVLDLIEHPAAWQTHGDCRCDVSAPYCRRAGFRRNALIVADADLVLAFRYHGSSGTRDTIDRARAANVPVIVFTGADLGECVRCYATRGDDGHDQLCEACRDARMYP